MSVAQRFRALAAWLSEVSAHVSSAALLVMALGISVDVLARSLVGSGTRAAVELTGYLMVAVVFFGLAPAQRAQAHIRIEVVTSLLPKAVSRILDFVNSLLFLGYCVVLAHLSLKSAVTSFEFGSTSRTNIDVIIWPFQLLIPIGLLVIVFVLTCEILFGAKPSREGAEPVIHD